MKKMLFNGGIDPADLAFDIDGVVADTMAHFIRLAREHYRLEHLTKEHISSYNLYQCLKLDKEVIDELICLTLEDDQTLRIPPMQGAPQVLTRLAQHGPLRFITARIWPESIIEWLHQTLPDVDSGRIHVIATGAPEAKTNVLKNLEIKVFVEDRIETCKLLASEGIQPIVFDQPWNRLRSETDFPRVKDWSELQEWVLPLEG